MNSAHRLAGWILRIFACNNVYRILNNKLLNIYYFLISKKLRDILGKGNYFATNYGEEWYIMPVIQSNQHRKKGECSMVRIKHNYYIEKFRGMYILKKRTFDQAEQKEVLREIGGYDSMRAAREAVVKEMIRDEVNHRKSEPLHEIIVLMKEMYEKYCDQSVKKDRLRA